jgi:hypothetical protein
MSCQACVRVPLWAKSGGDYIKIRFFFVVEVRRNQRFSTKNNVKVIDHLLHQAVSSEAARVLK